MPDESTFDHLSPDAPIHVLLSIRHNPCVETMTTEQLTAMVQQLRAYATSAPTLSAKLASDSNNANPGKRKPNAIAARKKALLDEI